MTIPHWEHFEHKANIGVRGIGNTLAEAFEQVALADQGILISSPSMRELAEEAPGAYKDVSAVVETADRTGLARLVAKLEPLICVKG
jgi:RNA-splicing ligase RtcB